MSSLPSEPLLRRIWIPAFGDAFYLGLVLALLAAVARGIGMLGPPRFFWIMPVGFVAMAMTPYLFFRKSGRFRAGLRRPRRPEWIVGGVLLGLAGAGLCYWLGVSLFGATDDNWFVSVRRAFPDRPEMVGMTTGQLFWMITIPSMIFSPLGEEIFFRGFLQQALEERWSRRKSVLVDAGWFAAIHLFHHGIVRVDGQLQFFPVSGAIWVVLIFGTGLLFSWVRQATGSLLAPILAHAAFNLGMNVAIFYFL